uniref:Ig-like domain-containing protein n=1 Tax=Sinocyclocheilus anshuiensis TaxID=1608454 RepID=A0A671QML3_9TELE
ARCLHANTHTLTNTQKQIKAKGNIFKRINGAEVEMKVRPGDNITLYCDRSVTFSSSIVWIRNCSHENQPSLIIGFRKLDLEIFQRFSFIHNTYNNSFDLHITNISVSDLGLYYCVEEENKLHEDEKGLISQSIVYYYGNQTTRLSLEGKNTLLLVMSSLV